MTGPLRDIKIGIAAEDIAQMVMRLYYYVILVPLKCIFQGRIPEVDTATCLAVREQPAR